MVKETTSSSKLSKILIITGIAAGLSLSGAFLIYRYKKDNKQFKRKSSSEYSITVHLPKSQVENVNKNGKKKEERIGSGSSSNNNSNNNSTNQEIIDNEKEKKINDNTSMASNLLEKLIKQQIDTSSEKESNPNPNEKKNNIKGSNNRIDEQQQQIQQQNKDSFDMERICSEIISDSQEINLSTENDTIHAIYSPSTPLASSMSSNNKIGLTGLSGLVNDLSSLENSSSTLTLMDRDLKDSHGGSPNESLIIYSTEKGDELSRSDSSIVTTTTTTTNTTTTTVIPTTTPIPSDYVLENSHIKKQWVENIKRKSLTEELIESESECDLVPPSTPKLHSLNTDNFPNSNTNFTGGFNSNQSPNFTVTRKNTITSANYSSLLNNNNNYTNTEKDTEEIRIINVDINNENETMTTNGVNSINNNHSNNSSSNSQEKVASQTDSINPLSIDINKFLLTQNFEFSDEEEQINGPEIINGIPIQKSVRRVSSISSTSTFKSAQSSWTESSQFNEDQANDDSWEVNSIASNCSSSTSGFYSAEEDFDNIQ